MEALTIDVLIHLPMDQKQDLVARLQKLDNEMRVAIHMPCDPGGGFRDYDIVPSAIGEKVCDYRQILS